MTKITNIQQTLLTNITLQKTSPQQLVFRAEIILATAEIHEKQTVAHRLNTSRDAVYRWIGRWQKSCDELERLESEHAAGHLSEPMYQRVLVGLRGRRQSATSLDVGE